MSELEKLFQDTYGRLMDEVRERLAVFAQVKVVESVSGEDPHVRDLAVKHGARIEVEGDEGAPGVRHHVREAAVACARLPERLLLETFFAAGDEQRLLPRAPVWLADGKPMCATGRLGRIEGNLLGGQGLDSVETARHDLERVQRWLGCDLAVLCAERYAPLFLAAYNTAGAEHPERTRDKLLAWGHPALSGHDWVAFRMPNPGNDFRAIQVVVEEPRCWVIPATCGYDMKDGVETYFSRKPQVMIATRASVEVKHPALCVKVERFA